MTHVPVFNIALAITFIMDMGKASFYQRPPQPQPGGTTNYSGSLPYPQVCETLTMMLEEGLWNDEELFFWHQTRILPVNS